jgi:F-type H+-transporting ATPase subunit delta
MDTGRISARYAKAIYEFALEQKEEKTVYGEMKQLVKSFQSFPLLKDAMDNPTVPALEKEKLLTTAAGISVSRTFLQVLKLIGTNHRESDAMQIARMYEDYYRRQKGIVIGKLITENPVTAEIKDKLRAIITAGPDKEIDFEAETDDSLIGGFIVEVDSNLLDASVKSQLGKIRRQLMEMNKNLLN